MEESWFQDVNIIIDEAKKLDMKIWFFDDCHYPTGRCNEIIPEKYPHLRKQLLVHRRIEVFGPMKKVYFYAGHPMDPAAEFYQAIAVQGKERIVLTELIQGNDLYWDVPEGIWYVYFIYKTTTCHQNPNNFNIIDRDSVGVLINTVYEAHYQHYKDEFGKTILGFFSDEAEMGNEDSINYYGKLGVMKALPWCQELEELLGERFCKCLPDLWDDSNDNENDSRYRYMETVTSLVQKNFSEQIGAWCEAHGISYIGHVIEDNNAHERLSYGLGHFFRSQKGQHMAGVDVVLNQLRPGLDSMNINWTTQICQWDGEFFHYLLGKLGSSLAQLDPQKKGRCFSEVFGATGWVNGLKMAKWQVDHLLVRGVNWFMPHGFSMCEFPDQDCPPHLYARGNNPHHLYTPYLMQYINRMCHLLQDGKILTNVGILYNAEQDWSGEAFPIQKVARELMQHQIDFDIIPFDYLKGIGNGTIHINEKQYDILVVAESYYMPKSIKQWLEQAKTHGLKVYEVSEQNVGMLSEKILKQGYIGVQLNEPNSWMRIMTYKRKDGTCYLFFNEHPHNIIRTVHNISEKVYRYDAFDNKLYEVEENQILLYPYESLMLISGDVTGLTVEKEPSYQKEIINQEGCFRLGKVPRRIRISCEGINETAVFNVNGQEVGYRICPPYRLEVDGKYLRKGKNQVTIKSIGTLEEKKRDFLSLGMPMEESGEAENIKIFMEEM